MKSKKHTLLIRDSVLPGAHQCCKIYDTGRAQEVAERLRGGAADLRKQARAQANFVQDLQALQVCTNKKGPGYSSHGQRRGCQLVIAVLSSCLDTSSVTLVLCAGDRTRSWICVHCLAASAHSSTASGEREQNKRC